MSIVVAVQKNGRIAMAADTLTCFGDHEQSPPANSTTAKVYPLGEAVFGAAGWAVYDDILAHYFESRPIPVLDSQKAIFAFFLELWKALHDGYPFVNDQATSKDTPFGDLDSTFLIASRGGIFKISSDLGVSTFNQYYAVGSGAEYAIGAIHVLYAELDDPELIARRAVEAAIAHDVHCGGEVEVLTVTAADEKGPA